MNFVAVKGVREKLTIPLLVIDWQLIFPFKLIPPTTCVLVVDDMRRDSNLDANL